MAPSLLLSCDTCKHPIAPGETYLVTPDIAGVGADTLACRRCDPDYQGEPVCTTCGEDLDNGDNVYHRDCSPDHVGCSKCGDEVDRAMLATIKCADCTSESGDDE